MIDFVGCVLFMVALGLIYFLLILVLEGDNNGK